MQRYSQMLTFTPYRQTKESYPGFRRALTRQTLVFLCRVLHQFRILLLGDKLAYFESWNLRRQVI
jgi:hypothetical protein